jgi:peptidoglycan/xylan/chitin deacetylase (PgdA/CDA1 family)
MPSSVIVLAYHHIATPGNPDLAPTVIDAYPPDFEAQMRYVAGHYNVVSSWDLVRALREGITLPPRALIITFDDGYMCFQDTAFPVLERLNLPVTLFVPTSYPDRPGTLFWWDAVYRALTRTTRTELPVPGLGTLPLGTEEEQSRAFGQIVGYIERLDEAEAARQVAAIVEYCGVAPNTTRYMLNWDELADLAARGVAIGPHTRHHPVLARATPERVRAEVEGSWADLQARLPRPLPIFCYPTGLPHAVNRTAAAAVRQAGLAGAVTMVSGHNIIGRTDPYLLYRIGMEAGESLRKFSLKLTPAARMYRRLKRLLNPAAAAATRFPAASVAEIRR